MNVQDICNSGLSHPIGLDITIICQSTNQSFQIGIQNKAKLTQGIDDITHSYTIRIRVLADTRINTYSIRVLASWSTFAVLGLYFPQNKVNFTCKHIARKVSSRSFIWHQSHLILLTKWPADCNLDLTSFVEYRLIVTWSGYQESFGAHADTCNAQWRPMKIAWPSG